MKECTKLSHNKQFIIPPKRHLFLFPSSDKKEALGETLCSTRRMFECCLNVFHAIQVFYVKVFWKCAKSFLTRNLT